MDFLPSVQNPSDPLPGHPIGSDSTEKGLEGSRAMIRFKAGRKDRNASWALAGSSFPVPNRHQGRCQSVAWPPSVLFNFPLLSIVIGGLKEIQRAVIKLGPHRSVVLVSFCVIPDQQSCNSTAPSSSVRRLEIALWDSVLASFKLSGLTHSESGD